MNRQYQSNKRSYRGFTLVEILVAITLSMILMAGVIQIYISSKESFRVQNELASLQENQRIALEFMRNDVARAGFSAAGRILGIINTVNRNETGSDEITVTYEATRDCLGIAPPANQLVVNHYFIDSNTNQLMCDGNGVGFDENGNEVAVPPQPIADGIENMQILYGEDRTTPMARPADPDIYVNAATANFNRVVAVRIALLFRTSDPIRTQTPDEPPSFALLDESVTTTADRIKRQVVTTTIPVRNAI